MNFWGRAQRPFLSERVQLHLGECREIMRRIPDRAFDLALTDPPYGISIARTLPGKGRLFSEKDWDAQIPDRYFFDELRRISKSQVIWGGNYFAHLLPASRCWIAWWKTDGLPRLSFADCELAWTSFDRNAYVFNSRWRGGIRDGGDEKQRHPTQKALALFRWCIETFSHEGASIFDPMIGSGTTAHAALLTGRKCFGIERDVEYFEIASRRLAAALLEST